LLGAVIAGIMLCAAIVSLHEREWTAARRAFALFVLLPIPYFAAGLMQFQYHTQFAAGLIALTGVAALILLVPTGSRHKSEDDVPRARIDERDTMFSRARLEPGSDRFISYYRENPEKRRPDDLFRSKAGLLSHAAKYYEPLSFAVADANFETVRSLHPLVDGELASETVETSKEKITRFIKGWAVRLGAVSVGIAELKDYHLYTIIGRGDDYGKAVTLNHKYAIAITVEMAKAMVDSAPFGPTVVESAQQYLRSGTIATQIAQFIRNLGYHARAHIDADYRVVCPLVARDAGLGEIGRMGLLMTPELGPRVRIAVVTTDAPLVADRRHHDHATIDFCTTCKKCATVCPSRAIPFDDRREIDGAMRWQISSEKCFSYWCEVGTDCARCVKVCPFSHPDSFIHNTIRMGVRHSSLFRWAALKLDDFFYGRKPAISDAPEWMKPRRESVMRR
jgi:reductive dehalogenase